MAVVQSNGKADDYQEFLKAYLPEEDELPLAIDRGDDEGSFDFGDEENEKPAWLIADHRFDDLGGDSA